MTVRQSSRVLGPRFGIQENAYMRMVLSYWEMAASMVTSGVLNEDLFLEPMQPRDPRYHGVTGLAIVDAILGGERDPATLAKLRDRRSQASEETIRKSLEGNWGQEHLFTLRQSRDSFRHHQKQILSCDEEIEKLLWPSPARGSSRTAAAGEPETNDLVGSTRHPTGETDGSKARRQAEKRGYRLVPIGEEPAA